MVKIEMVKIAIIVNISNMGNKTIGGWVGVLDEIKAILSPAGAWLWAELGNKALFTSMV